MAAVPSRPYDVSSPSTDTVPACSDRYAASRRLMAVLDGASRKTVGRSAGSTSDAPPSKTTNTGSAAGSLTSATATAPTPSVTSATAPSATASRAWATACCGLPRLSRTSTRTSPSSCAASRAPRSTALPTHGALDSGADTSTTRTGPCAAGARAPAGRQGERGARERRGEPHAGPPR